MFKTAGADRLMTVDLHTAQIQGFFDGPVDHLFALPLLADHVEAQWGDRDLVVVSPDAGRCASPSAGPTGSAAAWRSSTSAATRTSRTR
jgi:phosphoribosylpyrophosphate synthetase